jgi:mono/diheme cytochrome c family protein
MQVRWKWTFILVLMGLMFAASAGLAQEGGDAEHGAELYLTYCAMCHGEDGRGRIGANLQNFPGIDPGALIEQVVREGVSGSVMPAWGEVNGGPLSEADIEDISAYLTGVLSGTSPVAPAPTIRPPVIPTLSNIEGEPSQGAVIFQSNCAACHGERAQGGFGWPLARTWPGNDPQAYLRTVVSAGVEGSVMPAWSQQEGGPLSEQAIADVTAFILSLPAIEQLPTPAPAPEGPLSFSLSLIIFGVLALVVIAALVLYYRKA